MHPAVANFWINWNGFSNVGVLCIYGCIYTIISNSDKRHRRLGKIVKESDERRSLSSLMWLVSIFVATWCPCMLSQVIVSWMEPSEVTIVAETYAVIFALMSYSANYYVYFARNPTYRLVFMEQMQCFLPKRFHCTSKWDRATQSYVSTCPMMKRGSTPRSLQAEASTDRSTISYILPS
ncbi:unnamed protein product [Heligmosomoides polygyrus]|uniref:G_PROTEIN_RECEP_F1_2 domain-containing protein n=1 Tax=Heligmosomoides polygyrus TaxID=6339 RepID=A0A183GKA5_HELPZ|nr:unnamed protein product [Heligmosomoides polygyrus]